MTQPVQCVHLYSLYTTYEITDITSYSKLICMSMGFMIAIICPPSSSTTHTITCNDFQDSKEDDSGLFGSEYKTAYNNIVMSVSEFYCDSIVIMITMFTFTFRIFSSTIQKSPGFRSI